MQKRSISLEFTKQFVRDIGKLGSHQTDRLKERLELFIKNPKHPLLKTHELKGKLKNRFSINISGDIRAIYKILYKKKDSTLIQFVRLGTHSQLY